MLYLFAIVVLMLLSNVQAQSPIDSVLRNMQDSLEIQTDRSDRNAFWQKHTHELSTELGLAAVDSSAARSHFRLYTTDKILDIQERTLDTSHAFIMQWTREYVPADEKPTGRVHCLQRSLTKAQTDSLLNWITACGIDTLPSQEDLPGWEQGLDGLTYVIERHRNGRYDLRTYWSPNAQDSLPAALQVHRFVDGSLRIAAAGGLDTLFRQTVPFQHWENGSGRIGTRVYTYQQWRQMKMERNRYRKKKIKSKAE